MLILTRRVGETFMVGDEVSVTMLSIRGSQVRVGIKAPKGISIHRQEIYEKQHSEVSGESADVS